MQPTRSPGARSGNSGMYSPEMAESLRFEEEIQSLILQPTFESPPVSGSSFTALLGLPPTQAVELLHETLPLPLGCSPTFPSNAALFDRAARFSVFAAEEPPEVSNSGNISPAKLKAEPADSGDRPVCSALAEKSHQRPVAGSKRKESEKGKVKSSAKKNKSAEGTGGDEKQLPYVHVRARRGQATDSHSLAERARREKINARMKLLQELVPGCSKISGTALVLDEIINHVQMLQRQVEFLSMKLAAVNPRMDFGGLDEFLSAECGRLTEANEGGTMGMEQSAWLAGMIKQQMWLIDLQQQQLQQQQMWERDDTQQSHIFVSNSGSTASLFDSANPTSVSVPAQLKTELASSVLLPAQLKTEL